MRVAFAMLVGAVAIGSLVADVAFIDYLGASIVTALAWLAFAVVGAFLVLRRAGDPIGWLLGGVGSLLLLGSPMSAYGYASLQPGAALPVGHVVLWLLSSFVATIAFGLGISALVRFPNGRPPSRALAILLWVFVALIGVVAISGALADRPIDVPRPFAGPHASDPLRVIANPFALHGALGVLMMLGSSAIYFFPVFALIAPVALVSRFQRSRGIEREQLKWLTYTAALAAALVLIGFLSPRGPIADLAQAASVVGIGLLPVAIGIAVTRFRLYEIDVLIRRTVVYGAISLALVTTYLTAVIVLQALLRPITSGSELAVSGSTLIVVALFQPVRSLIQHAVDRRFYRSKYDAARTIDTFAARLRQQVDLAAVEGELMNAVRMTVQPTHASLWLRAGPRDLQADQSAVRRGGQAHDS